MRADRRRSVDRAVAETFFSDKQPLFKLLNLKMFSELVFVTLIQKLCAIVIDSYLDDMTNKENSRIVVVRTVCEKESRNDIVCYRPISLIHL